MRTKDKCCHLASLSHSSQAKTLQNRRDCLTPGRSPQVFFVLCKVAWSRKARRSKDRALTTGMPLPSGRFPGSPTQVLLLFYLIVIFTALCVHFCFSISQMIENNVQGLQTWSYGNTRQFVRRTISASWKAQL